ncbi:MAG: hypothetical protein NTY98_12095 [Verrucomicrobia bacterium]|nr:hypothetical protein [Verrucomicrobiota bacterium]
MMTKNESMATRHNTASKTEPVHVGVRRFCRWFVTNGEMWF